MKPSKLDVDSPKEEMANVLTHAVGIIFGYVGIVLVILRVPSHEISRFWSTIIFFLSMIILYSASTVYHFVTDQKRKYLFKQLDHAAIYILIAGTFTPFAWGVLGEKAFGINMLIGIWAIATAGIIFKTFFTGRFEAISLLSYLGMGWLGFLMFDRISEELGNQVVNFMIYGGISYTVGIIFYLMRKLKYHHAIWHLFVLGGTGFHYWAVLNYIVY
ncbi:hemolysin III family protein [Roseivirga sp. E12]|uniref:PAQR family membrane homeostasis protein TrhA n=1 Tax=Roseivirga sp. E12 TaxID=2819237 RepID=UPI001ABBF0E5|nr:hemolysin III family protein [Roseivirga sp. E12]MBO3698711.1 hemolysin III family protein [Roseivirga sp. E12]